MNIYKSISNLLIASSFLMVTGLQSAASAASGGAAAAQAASGGAASRPAAAAQAAASSEISSELKQKYHVSKDPLINKSPGTQIVLNSELPKAKKYFVPKSKKYFVPKYRVSNTQATSRLDHREYFFIDRALIRKYSGLIRNMTDDQNEDDEIVIPIPFFSTSTIIQFMEWLEAYDTNSQALPPVNVDMIKLAYFLNLKPAAPSLQTTEGKNAKQTFYKQAGKYLLNTSPADIDQLSIVHFYSILPHLNPHQRYSLYRNASTSNPYFKEYFEFYHTITLQQARTVTGQVDEMYVIATEAEVRALTANDQTVNRFFTNNPNAVLVVDLGQSTTISDNFGYNTVNISSTIPTSIRHMIIQGDRLTSVGDAFLYICRGLTTLDLSNTQIRSVGGSFLAECSGLTTLTLPNTLTSVRYQFLRECTSLTTLDLSNTQITSVESQFLYGCSRLTRLTLPNALTSVGNLFLHGCSGLTPGSVLIKIDTATHRFFFSPPSSSYRPSQSEDPDYVQSLLRVAG